LIGFWNSCVQAIFSYVGVELVGIAADEAERQRTVLPKAVRRVSWRVLIYYVGAITVLGLNLSATDPILQNSVKTGQLTYVPFGLMFERAGIPVLNQIVAAVALLASASSANTSLYLGSRTLYALAWEKQAPKIFLTKHIFDVPIWALIVTAIPSVLAYWGVTASQVSYLLQKRF
jgi:amino acid permease